MVRNNSRRIQFVCLVVTGLWLMSIVLPLLFAGQSESSEGFRPLFDGRSLEGWVQHGGEATYEIEDGVIVGISVPDTPNSFLCTTRDFGNFVLELDFMVDPSLNSGVQIRSQVFDEARTLRWTASDGTAQQREIFADRVHGYQVEIDPSDRAWTGGVYDEARRGWLANLEGNEAAQKAFRQNQWNHFRIEAVDDSIKTWLNGVQAASLRDDMTLKGLIALQVHGVGDNPERVGKQVRWRNIRIKELP